MLTGQANHSDRAYKTCILHVVKAPSKKPTLVICSSANFYQEVVAMQLQLRKRGYKVIIPITAERMKRKNNYTVEKSWLTNSQEYARKTGLIRAHFQKVASGDAILVVNNEKHGVANYIGGNVLMEMALAFYHKLPIFLLNDIPGESPFKEEVLGLGSIPLHGKVENLPKQF